jgi:mRNA interferase HigB
VISRKKLKEFWEKHPDAELPLRCWFKEVANTPITSPNQLKKMYPSASILQNNRVVFNIKGNTYRLVVKMNYDYQLIWIRYVGTHANYDKIDANKI